jgi:hypothetical protein
MATLARTIISLGPSGTFADARIDYVAANVPTKPTRLSRRMTPSQIKRRRYMRWLSMFEREDMTVREIAAEYKMPVRTIYSGMERARKLQAMIAEFNRRGE